MGGQLLVVGGLGWVLVGLVVATGVLGRRHAHLLSARVALMHWLLVFIARGAGVVGLGLVVLVVATADDLGLVVALRWVLLRILLLVSILLVLLESLPNVLVRLVVAERRLTAELLGVRVRVGLILIVLISLFLTRIFRAL